MPYSGRGWTETCAQILHRFPSLGLDTTVVLPRATRPLPGGVEVVPVFGPLTRRLPWRLLAPRAEALSDRAVRAAVATADPRSTTVYVWPGTSRAQIDAAREAGLVVVRQMINCTMATARHVLDAAYASRGLEPAHGITAEDAEVEAADLRLCDVVLAPNEEVERSLLEAGVLPDRIVPTSFGWSPERFAASPPPAERAGDVTFLFVGIVGVRKGVLDLLDAWELAGRPGRLVLVGDAEPTVAPYLAAAVRAGALTHVPYTQDVGQYFRAADVLVVPTLEEGGPQVTLEAGGLGVPVVATPMGTARLVEHGRNGLVVRPGDVAGLAASVVQLSEDRQLRQELGRQIAEDARAFTYAAVSARHAQVLVSALEGTGGVRPS